MTKNALRIEVNPGHRSALRTLAGSVTITPFSYCVRHPGLPANRTYETIVDFAIARHQLMSRRRVLAEDEGRDALGLWSREPEAAAPKLRQTETGAKHLRRPFEVRSGDRIMISQAMQEFRFAFRSLGKSPRFAAASIGTLVLAIGDSTAMFSVPFRSPEQLAMLWTETQMAVWDPRVLGLAAALSLLTGILVGTDAGDRHNSPRGPSVRPDP